MNLIELKNEVILEKFEKYRNLIILIDDPNSKDVDFELLYEYVFDISNNPKFYYFFSDSTQIDRVNEAVRLGFELEYTGAKDVDYKINNFLSIFEIFSIPLPDKNI